jgi:hypothetical protein
MKKFKANTAKIYSFSEISSSFNENTEDIIALFSSTFGSGLISFSAPSSAFFGERIVEGSNTFYTIGIDDNQKLRFIDHQGISNISDTLVRYSILFDDLRTLNGSAENPIEFQKTFRYVKPSSTPSRSATHSFEDVLTVYVNGTPLYNSEFSIENNNGNRRLVLRRIRFGKIFPSPKDRNGKFFKDLIEDFGGVSKTNLQNKLKDDDGYILLEFPFLKTKITDKELVLEVIKSANNRKYYNIPRHLPKYRNRAFYVEDSQIPGLIRINLGDLESTLSSSDKVRFFFVSKAIKKSSGNLVRKYSVGLSGLSPETSSLKEIFILDERTGEFIKIDDAIYSSIAEPVVFNYQTGEFDILTSVLPYSYAPIYFGNIVYYPPLKASRNLDYVNNISIFGHWGFTWKGTLSSPKNVYIKNDHFVDNASSVYDSQNNLVNLISSYQVQSYVNDSQGILLGTINPTDGSLALNSSIETPFDRLRDLCTANFNATPIVYSLRNLVFSSNGSVYIPILTLVQNQVLRFYGVEFILKSTDSSSGNLTAPPGISIVVDYGSGRYTLASYSSTQLSQQTVGNLSVYKNLQFDNPVLYTHTNLTPGIVYITFNINDIVLEISLANIYVFTLY